MNEALPLLPALGFAAIEIAPFNVFGRWDDVLEDARRLRDAIAGHGLLCTALQGIIYNVADVELFASAATRGRLARHLEGVAALAGILGARACVFGAPRQRDPGELSPAQAWDIAVRFFRTIGPAFAAQQSALAFEANATRYACRFVTTTDEAAALVVEVATPGFGLQIDTGTIFLEHEAPEVLRLAAPLAVHAHVSEPDLQVVGVSGLDHASIATALHTAGYAGSLSIEMRADADWRGAVARAAAFVQATYL